jgi:hypothetical protein
MSAFDFPPQFRTRDVLTNGASIHLRAGGARPAVRPTLGDSIPGPIRMRFRYTQSCRISLARQRGGPHGAMAARPA